MYIQSIIIKNFRCFKEIAIDFETLSILVGENGTGKTAILEAINYVFSSSYLASRIDEQDFNGNEDIYIHVYLSDSFKVILPDGYQTREVPCDQIYLSIKRREKASPNKAFSEPYVITHYVKPDKSVRQVGTEKWVVPRGTGSEFQIAIRHLSFPIDSDSFPRVFYLNKDRDNQAESGFNTTLNRIITEYNWRFRKKLDDFKDDYVSEWNSFYKRIIDSIDDKKYKETFVDVKDKLNALAGKGFENLEFSIFNLSQPFNKGFFAKRDGLTQINFRNFGSGISMILSFCFLDTISKLSKEKIIFLIDEPEMHLHHQLQRKLFEYIDNSEFQVIYTTHSESLVPLNKWKSIKRVSKKYDCFPKTVTLDYKLPFKGSNETIENHLTDISKYYQDKTIFLKENNILFFARNCILVEGPVDKYAIEILSKSDLNDTTIITCYGKDKIFYYQMLCKTFEIPYFSLFDLDGNGIDEEPNLTIIESSFKHHFYGFPISLEASIGVDGSKHKASKSMDIIDNLKDLPQEINDALERIDKFIEEYKKDFA